MKNLKSAEEIQYEWEMDPRWAGIKRTYTAQDVVRLRGTVVEESKAESKWVRLRRAFVS